VLKHYNGGKVTVKQDRSDERGRFDLLPAIDLRGGRVVRLVEGDFKRETAYSVDPVGVAEALATAGVTWIHVVDLDGARIGAPRNTGVVADIVASLAGRISIELGGGLRTEATVDAALATGCARVVVGTAALEDPAFVGGLVRRHGPSRIAVALDVRDGLAVGEAWRRGASGTPVLDATTRITDEGVETLVVTAIRRDGRLQGPDVQLLELLVGHGQSRIIASGGISSTDDVLATRQIGCAGAIVGRALYEGRIDLRLTLEALAAGPG
jgi:phosphoribosylformimino-5-aminoimidazole carboxamide ribotide isomerase